MAKEKPGGLAAQRGSLDRPTAARGPGERYGNVIVRPALATITIPPNPPSAKDQSSGLPMD
jgi:hypothetical protein